MTRRFRTTVALAPTLIIALCWLAFAVDSASALRRGGGGGGFATQDGKVLGQQLGAPTPLAGAVVEIRGPIIATATTGDCQTIGPCEGGLLGFYAFPFNGIPAGTYVEDATYTPASGIPIACFDTQTRQTSPRVTLVAGETKTVNWTCLIPSS
jgi:hypothetical protein